MIFLIALALALDAFAVTTGIGASQRGLKFRDSFRLAFHFGLFQFLMPLVGWLAGEEVIAWIETYDHWVAFCLLAFVGSRMIFSGFKSDQSIKIKRDPTRGWSLVLLSVATSLDALAVGFSLATIDINIWLSALLIGITAFLMTLVAAGLSPYLGRLAGRWAELVGGIILIGIGLRIVISHLGWNRHFF
ncbi:MAG: manganese efflux pump MntP family protein [Candidatus Aminicenantes bacterium]|nr:manganese efflux pump MntP family protein [Candidatus Aminicenantes bacterium]